MEEQRDRRREQVHKLLDLAMDINSFEPRTKARTADKPTAFFTFCGHCGDLVIQLFKDGWEPGVRGDYEEVLYTRERWYNSEAMERAIAELQQLKEELNERCSE